MSGVGQSLGILLICVFLIDKDDKPSSKISLCYFFSFENFSVQIPTQILNGYFGFLFVCLIDYFEF